MKAFLVFISVLICNNVVSQQNFINVPTSEVTKSKKVFFQQQINFNEIIQSNTTIDYGLGKGFEVGTNILGLNFSEKNKTFFNNDTNDIDPYNPVATLNALKKFSVNENVGVSLGTQYGADFSKSKEPKSVGLVYSNLILHNLITKNSHLVFGVYYNSHHYGGQGNRFGAWAGTEVLLTNKIHLMAESVLGNNSLCYTSLGFVYYPHKKLPLTLGVQIPNTKKNSYSIVFELTYVP